MVESDFSVAFSEILEQPNLLAGLRDTRDTWTRPFVNLCREHDFKRVLFVGNGSPYSLAGHHPPAATPITVRDGP